MSWDNPKTYYVSVGQIGPGICVYQSSVKYKGHQGKSQDILYSHYDKNNSFDSRVGMRVYGGSCNTTEKYLV